MTRAGATEFGDAVVFKEPGPEWSAFEDGLDGRGAPLVLQGRAAFVRSTGEDVWLLGLRDGSGKPECAFALTVGKSMALPGARLVRAPRFGHGLPAARLHAACAALAELARAERVLRAHVDLYEPDPECRKMLIDVLAEAGFERSDHSRSYERTQLVGLAVPEEELFASFHKKCRRDIRLAEKRSFVCRTVDEISLAPRMDDLVTESMSRTGGPRLHEDWARWVDFARAHPTLVRIVGIFQSGVSGSAALVGFVEGLRHGDTVEYSVAASTRIPGNNTPLLYAPTWDLMRWAKAGGATTFDFGGITAGTADSDDPVGGISDFKRYFGGTVAEVGGEMVFAPSRWRAVLAASVSATVGKLRGVVS